MKETRGRKKVVSNVRIKNAHAKGLSLAGMAKELGISPQAIGRRLNQMGLIPNRPPQKPTERVRHEFKVLPETLDKIAHIRKTHGGMIGAIVDNAVALYHKEVKQ